MNYDRFIRERENNWKELDIILERIKSFGVGKLSRTELDRFGKLYRLATSHLAVARTYFPNSDVSQYLNQLVAKAHANIYRARIRGIKNILNFFYYDIPVIFQKRIVYIALAFTIFASAGLAGFLGCYIEEDLPRIIVGDEYIDKTEDNIAKGEPCAVYKTGVRPLASSVIMTNNIGVAFYAFSLGILMGFGTLMILIFNGLVFGSITFVFYQSKYLLEFLSTVMLHGTIELACVFIAGGAGILLGDALINPRGRFRKDALIENGKESIKLIIAIIPWFILAGIIEGYITPMDLSIQLRLAVIIITGVIFITYFTKIYTKIINFYVTRI